MSLCVGAERSAETMMQMQMRSTENTPDTQWLTDAELNDVNGGFIGEALRACFSWYGSPTPPPVTRSRYDGGASNGSGAGSSW
jgi:hypothetical protein